MAMVILSLFGSTCIINDILKPKKNSKGILKMASKMAANLLHGILLESLVCLDM